LEISFLILDTRKKNWQNPKIIWQFCTRLLAIGLYGILVSKAELREDGDMLFLDFVSVNLLDF
jgi:hypothetical protein